MPEASALRTPDDQALDAYSQAVTSVVERVGPAVVALAVRGRRRWRGGTGSGFLVAPDGYALTNSHVVRSARAIRAQLADGRIVDCRVVGDDPATDLAVVRVHAEGLAHVELAEPRTPRPGQIAIAIGSPLGLSATVTAGVVSALGRSLHARDGRLIDNVVQHTAPLNPGSSGGPLLSSDGALLGVNTAIIAFSQGIGFAVPATTVAHVVPQLLSRGRVRRSRLGIAGGVRPIPRALVRSLGLTVEAGVHVAEVVRGSPAHRAGVRTEDLVVGFAGGPVTALDELVRALGAWEPGRPAPLRLLRDGRLVDLVVVPDEA